MIKRFSIVLALIGAALTFGAGMADADPIPDPHCHTGIATVDGTCMFVGGQGWGLEGGR